MTITNPKKEDKDKKIVNKYIKVQYRDINKGKMPIFKKLNKTDTCHEVNEKRL